VEDTGESLPADAERRLSIHRAEVSYRLNARLFTFASIAAGIMVALGGWGASQGEWVLFFVSAACFGALAALSWRDRETSAQTLIDNGASIPKDVSLLPPAIAAAVVSGVFGVIVAMIDG
jgi:hypothetical protein